MGKKSNRIKKHTKERISSAKKDKQGKRQKSRVEIPFYRSVGMRLILSFFIPVAGVAALGIVSYSQASSAIIRNYKESIQQTTVALQQYVSLVLDSEKEDFKTYLTQESFRAYFQGVQTEENERSTGKEYRASLRNKQALDSKLHSVYFLGDGRHTITAALGVIDGDKFTEYSRCKQGENVCKDVSGWYVFGQDDESDYVIGLKDKKYCIRIAKKINTSPGVMLINISSEYIREAMKSLDPGEGGYVALVTTDGGEFYANPKTAPESAMLYGTDFYRQALEGEETNGNQMVRLNGKEYMFVYSRIELGDVMVVTMVPSARLLQETAGIKQLTIILSIVCAIIALVLGALISRQISGTIRYVMHELHKVSTGDLTVHLKTKRKDEFGLLCTSVNDTVDHMKGLILDVNDVSRQVGAAAENVAEASGTFLMTSQDIQNAVEEIESGVSRLDSGSDNCMSQMDTLSGKINNVSISTGQIQQLTDKTSSTINAGIASVQTLTQSAGRTADITRDVIVSIEELEKRSKDISNIALVINEIAESTNLLSLNASIEAARAGEAGRGFSVVAEEIRKLADECLDSSRRISGIVDEIIGKTEDVVKIAREAETVVNSQSDVVENTTSSFRQIEGLVSSLVTALGAISSDVQEIDGARNKTLSAIESISDASTQTAECSSSVHSAAGTQMEAIRNLDEASQSLTNKAESLMDTLSSFRV